MFFFCCLFFWYNFFVDAWFFFLFFQLILLILLSFLYLRQEEHMDMKTESTDGHCLNLRIIPKKKLHTSGTIRTCACVCVHLHWDNKMFIPRFLMWILIFIFSLISRSYRSIKRTWLTIDDSLYLTDSCILACAYQSYCLTCAWQTKPEQMI